MLLTSWLCGWSGRARAPLNDWPRHRRRLRPHEVRRWMAPNIEPLEMRLVPTNISFFTGPGDLLIESGGEVHRSADIDRVCRCDLRLQQVEPQRRVLATDRGWMVAPTVVALAEDRDRVHMPQSQHVLELGGGKSRADARNLLAGVEIQMDLAKAHGFTCR